MIKTLLLFIFLLAANAAYAESYETVMHSLFKTADGRPTTIVANGRPTLVLFWAGWCVPCKEELGLVADGKDKVAAKWNVVAVNVDDAGGKIRAEGILKSIKWPFQSLYDDGGAIFYQINSSGELPLALAFDPQGHLSEVIRELRAPALEKLSQAEFSKNEKATGWDVNEEFQFVQRRQSAGNSDVGTNTLGVRYAGEKWQVAASHNLIRQKRDPQGGWTRFEDELGPSYLQWQDTTRGLTSVRLGDDAIEWGKGALISARPIPGSDVNASLQGAHFNQSFGGFSIAAAAGRVREQLFGLLLDPTVDQTQEVPPETAYGLKATQAIKLSSTTNFKVSAGALDYHRDALASVSTSYLTPYSDQRLFGDLGVNAETWGIDVADTHYTILRSQETDLKHSDAAQVDAYLRSGAEAKYQLAGTYIERRDVLPRTFTPVLTDYPAYPLTIEGIRTWRVAPRALFGKWILEPQWVAEQSTRPDDFEKQNTYVIELLRPESEFKSILLYQKHGSNPLAMDAEQAAGVFGVAFTPMVSGQLEYKTYRAKGRDGNSAADQTGKSASVQVAVKMERLLNWPSLGQMQWALTRTHQDGYYLTTSGIDRNELTGFRVTWTRGPFELRLAACQEPGGLVCSGGVCAQRPPLDGFSVESKMHWNF